MKIKYKLIKTYPTCKVKLGTIVLKGESHDPNPDKYGTEDNECFFTVAEVENHPEFWQKVLEEKKLCVPVGTKFKTNPNSILCIIYKIEGDIAWIRLDGGVNKGINYKLSEVNEYFKNGSWKIYSEPETKEEIMQKCIKMFPKGSLVKSPQNDEICRIRTEDYSTEYNNLIEGVYYDWVNDSGVCILALSEDNPIGFFLYYNGKYGELVQEEPKKEYGILEFKAHKHIPSWEGNSAKLNKEDGKYYLNEKSSWTLDSLLNQGLCVKNGGFYISKVRRLSDNEEFSVGDKVKISKLKHTDGSFIIDKFYFDCNNDKLLCNGNNTGNGHVSITKIQKVKTEKLFTTFDGVDIYSGGTFYFIHDSSEIINTVHTYKNSVVKIEEPVKAFSTKEKAEEYLKLNKKCLSLQDIIDVNSEKFVEGEMYKKLLDKIKC